MSEPSRETATTFVGPKELPKCDECEQPAPAHDFECEGTHMTDYERYKEWEAQGFPGREEEHLDLDAPVRASEDQVGGTHYKDFRIQPGLFSTVNKISHMRGEAIDYICRSQVGGGEKQDPIKDLLKAKHCIDLVLEWEYRYVDHTRADSS